MSHDLADLLEQTARGPRDPAFDPAEIAVRARRWQRWQAVGAVAVVLVLAAGGVWGIRSLTAPSGAPFIEPGPIAGQVPAGWQTITIGAAEVSVPDEWRVVDLDDDPTAYCTRFLGTATLYVGPAPQPPPSCPSPLEGDPVVGVHAVGFTTLGGAFDGRPVEVNGQTGTLTDDDGQIRSYVFPELGLMLEVSYPPDPELANQVLSTLRPAPVSEPTPARPSATATSSDAEPGRGDAWMTEAQRDAWEREHGNAQWVVGYFYPSGLTDVEGAVDFAGLETRWKRVDSDGQPGDPEGDLRRAYRELATPPPDGLVSLLEGEDLTLLRATLDGGTLTLNFRLAGWSSAAKGTTGEAMMFNQLAIVAAHYFTDAEQLCILIDGDEVPLFSHGLDPCPHQLP